MIKHWILQVLISIDQLLNTIFGGYADETLSARAWRAEQDGKILGRFFRPVFDFILFFDPDHCYNSYLSEIAKRQFPRPYR